MTTNFDDGYRREEITKTFTPQWEKPSYKEEEEEITRTAHALGISVKLIANAFEKAGLEELNDAVWSAMKNCDSREGGWTIERVKQHLQGSRDVEWLEKIIKGNKSLDAAGVLFRSNERPYLMWGNSRLLVCRVTNVHPQIVAVRLG